MLPSHTYSVHCGLEGGGGGGRGESEEWGERERKDVRTPESLVRCFRPTPIFYGLKMHIHSAPNFSAELEAFR